MRTPQEAMRNFIYFSLNYDYKFIEKCWADWPDSGLIDHLKEKFQMIYNQVGALGVMVQFMSYLSTDHQIRLAKWIDENYNEIKAEEYKITSVEAKKVLKEAGYVLPLWIDEDIQQQAKEDLDRELTPDELDKVMYRLQDGHDASIGINWDVISEAINFIVNE